MDTPFKIFITVLLSFPCSFGVEICPALKPGSTCRPSCPVGFVSKGVGYPFCYSGQTCCSPLEQTTSTTTTTTTTSTTATTTTTTATSTTTTTTATTSKPGYVGFCTHFRPTASCMERCPIGFTQKGIGFPFCPFGAKSTCCEPTSTTTTTTTTTMSTTTTRPPSLGLCSYIHQGSLCYSKCPHGSIQKQVGFPYCYFGYVCCDTTAAATTTSTTTTTYSSTTTTSKPSSFGLCSYIHIGASCYSQCPQGSTQHQVGFPYCYFGSVCCEPTTVVSTTTTSTTTTSTTTTTQPPNSIGICPALYPGSVCVNTCPSTATEQAAGFPFCLSGLKCCLPSSLTTTVAPNTTTHILRDLCGLYFTGATCTMSCPLSQQINHPSLSFCRAGLTCCQEPTPHHFNSCGITGGRTKRSIGGEVNPACSWPWLVSIRVENPLLFVENSHVITGVLISNSSVLIHRRTFDNTVDTLNDEHLIVEASTGEYYINMVGDETRRDRINMSAATTVGDFQILHLPRPVVMNECVRPICIPTDEALSGNASLDTTRCKMVGWGDTESGSGELTLYPVPLSTDVTLYDETLCQQYVTNTPDLSHTTSPVCLTLPQGHAATQGDRGSPIMCPDTSNRWFLMGILVKGNYVSTPHSQQPPIVAANVILVAEDLLDAAGK